MEKYHFNPRGYSRNDERAPGIGFTLNRVLAFLIIFYTYQSQALAQSLLSDDGNTHKVVASSEQGLREGVPQTFRINPNTSHTAISFTIRGGDGGRARSNKSSCAENGGDGAVVKMTVSIGNGSGEIPPGSEIRFFAGKAGDVDSYKSGGHCYGGGGGGSAVTVRFPGKTGDTDWIILAVAGGGAGAEARFDALKGCVTEKTGQGGRDFNWNRNVNGDGGNPGGKNHKAGGGGGGAYHDGRGYNAIKGRAGYPNGGRGGIYSLKSAGGWGFGGGGGGGKDKGTFHGGGGGGYTGGNATQGGGSWVNTVYDRNATLIAGGSTDHTDDGYIVYQFKETCSIKSVVTTATTCGTDGSATINVTSACANQFNYGVQDAAGNLKASKNTKFSGLAAGTYTAYIWRGEFLDGVSGKYRFTIPQGTCN